MFITYREWRVFWNYEHKTPVLYSTFVPYKWVSDTVTADELPNDLTTRQPIASPPFYHLSTIPPHGIHSALQSSRNSFLTRPTSPGPKLVVQGAVHPYGYVKVHVDGVLRSEYARILALRVVDVPFPMAACEHVLGDDLVVVNVPGEGTGNFQIRRCACAACGGPEYDEDAYSVLLSENMQPVVLEKLTTAELETRLCHWYEVPKLEWGRGPWDPPWGEGPVDDVDGN